MIETAVTTLKSWMAASSETLAIILNQGVYPDPPNWRQVKADELEQLGQKGLTYTLALAPIEGQLELFLPLSEAGRMVDLLVGGDGLNPPTELTDLHLNVLSEALNQLASGLADMLSTIKGRPTRVRLGDPRRAVPTGAGADDFLWVDFPLSLDDGQTLQLSIVLPTQLAGELGPGANDAPEEVTFVSRPAAPRFEPVDAPAPPGRDAPRLDLILDVPLQVQVVLGRTSVLVSELMKLGEGSILELDRLAGEPVELYVHDRLVAFAEVVVIDEKFGVKILDLAKDQRQKGRSTVVA